MSDSVMILSRKKAVEGAVKYQSSFQHRAGDSALASNGFQ